MKVPIIRSITIPLMYVPRWTWSTLPLFPFYFFLLVFSFCFCILAVVHVPIRLYCFNNNNKKKLRLLYTSFSRCRSFLPRFVVCVWSSSRPTKKNVYCCLFYSQVTCIPNIWVEWFLYVFYTYILTIHSLQ